MLIVVMVQIKQFLPAPKYASNLLGYKFPQSSRAPRPPKRCLLHILPPHPLHHQLAAHGRGPAVLCLARVCAVTTVGGRCSIRSL